MIHHVLLGYDGSESADRALDFALDLADKYSAELHVLAVARPPELASAVEWEAVIASSQLRYDQVLHAARVKLADASVKTHFHLLAGQPAEQIVRYAEAHNIDHIVVGHRGNTLFERWLIGSVARHVISVAPCAVTVVRDHGH
jgi:nucleotide-binding universal stress UspA family protein